MLDGVFEALRFAQYVTLMLLMGGAAFPFVALRAGRRTMRDPWSVPLMAMIGIAAMGFTLATMIASVAAMMGVSLWQVDLPMIRAIVTGTGMGWAFLIREGALVAALVAMMLVGASQIRSIVVAVLSAASLATLAWSGHAAATAGLAGVLHRVNDAAHLIGASLWIGAIAGFFALSNAAHGRPKSEKIDPLLDALHGFAPVGILLVGVVSITGLLNAEMIFGIANMPKVFTSDYGVLLAAKVGLVGVMLLCAARNASMGRRHAIENGRAEDDVPALLRSLRSSLAMEALAGIAVVAVVAILGTLSPGL